MPAFSAEGTDGRPDDDFLLRAGDCINCLDKSKFGGQGAPRPFFRIFAPGLRLAAPDAAEMTVPLRRIIIAAISVHFFALAILFGLTPLPLLSSCFQACGSSRA